MNWIRLILLTLFTITAAGCGSGSSDGGSDDGGNSGGGSSSENSASCGEADENGVITCTADATSTDRYVYFDAENLEAVDISDGEAAASDAWHIAFRRYAVKLNGGDSGPGSIGGALAVPQDDFYDSEGEPNASVFTNATPESEYEHLIGELPEPESWTLDSVTTAFDVEVEEGTPTYDYGWYFYNVVSGDITANPENGWLLRSSEGDSFARVRVTDIDFPTRLGNGVQSFEISFDVQPADTGQFTSTASFTGSIPGEGGEVCFDFDTDQNVDCTGEAWDLKIGFFGRDFFLRTNSGPSGDGAGGAFGPIEWSELSTYTSATTHSSSTDLTSHYTEDTTGGIFDAQSWYAYNLQENHKLWPNYRVYLVTMDSEDENAAQYAVQIIDYYDEAGEESGHITFRFRPVAAE